MILTEPHSMTCVLISDVRWQDDVISCFCLKLHAICQLSVQSSSGGQLHAVIANSIMFGNCRPLVDLFVSLTLSKRLEASCQFNIYSLSLELAASN